MMIILLILITLSLDSVWILLGENCWSLLETFGRNETFGRIQNALSSTNRRQAVQPAENTGIFKLH